MNCLRAVSKAQRVLDKHESLQALRREANEKDRRIKQLQTDRDREAKRFVYKICLISCVLELYLFVLAGQKVMKKIINKHWEKKQ